MSPAPKTPIRFLSLGILQGIETRGGAFRASRSFSPGVQQTRRNISDLGPSELCLDTVFTFGCQHIGKVRQI